VLPWRESLVTGAVLAAWFGALWLYYGWPLPQTLGAKNAQRASGIWRPLGMELVEWFKARTPAGSPLFETHVTPGFTLLLGLALAGLPALLWLRHWWLLIAWPVIYLLAYRQLHLPFYHWYAVPPLIAIVASAAAACSAFNITSGWLMSRLRGGRQSEGPLRTARERSVASLLIVTALIVLLVWPMGRHSMAWTRSFPNRFEVAYDAAGRWLADHTPPDASIGYLEIGIIGYRSERTIVDPLGLVNPYVAPHIAERDFLWAYRHHQPDYIIDNPVFFPDLLGKVVREPWFVAAYERMADLDCGRDLPMTVYRRTAPRTAGR